MNRAIQMLARKSLLLQPAVKNVSTTTVRNHGVWVYRRSGQETIPKTNFMIAEALGGIMWFWILYHIWHEPDHILGEFPYPDPSKWTDAELGIPSK